MGSPWAFHGGLLTSDSHSGGFSFTTASFPKPTCPRVKQWSGLEPQRAHEAIYTVQSQHVSRNRKTIPVRPFGGTSPSSCKSVLGEILSFDLQISQVLYPKWTGQGRSPQGPTILPPLCLLLIPKWRSLVGNQRKLEHTLSTERNKGPCSSVLLTRWAWTALSFEFSLLCLPCFL